MKILMYVIVFVFAMFTSSVNAKSVEEIKQIFDYSAELVIPICEKSNNYDKCMEEQLYAFIELHEVENTWNAKVKEEAYIDTITVNEYGDLVDFSFKKYLKLGKTYQRNFEIFRSMKVVE